MHNLKKYAWLVLFVCGCAVSMAAESAPIPYKGEEVLTTTYFIRLIIVFTVIVGLAYAIIFFLKRYYLGGFTKSSAASSIVVHDIKKLTPKLTVVHLQARDNEYLIVATDTDVKVVDKYEKQENSAAAADN